MQKLNFQHLKANLTYWERFWFVGLEVEKGDFVSHGGHHSVAVGREDEVSGSVHRPVQVREPVAKLHRVLWKNFRG